MKSTRLAPLPLALLPSMLATLPALAADKPALATKIEAVINHEDYKTATWGILILDQGGGGEVLYEHNADKLLAAASTTKLFTVATALDTFGPDLRFETSIYRQGDVSEGRRTEGRSNPRRRRRPYARRANRQGGSHRLQPTSITLTPTTTSCTR